MKVTLSNKPDPFQTKQINPVSLTLFIVFFGAGIIAAAALDGRVADGIVASVTIVFFAVAVYLLFAIKIANQWEKAVVLRFGKFSGLRGPGLFAIVPLMDAVTAWIDQRVMVTSFGAEKTLTKEATQKLHPPSVHKSRQPSAPFHPPDNAPAN
ncbi:MAG: hypothetical protein HY679_02560 [Chloroflexi bacterium]|nr:hypothetical protein [Chloroflexota bacterium]